RLKELKRQIKDLERLQAERNQQETDVREAFDREIRHIHESAADLLRICSDPAEAARYFAIADRQAIVDNEINLNLPRYVDPFEPEEVVPLDVALVDLRKASASTTESIETLDVLLRDVMQPVPA